MPMRLPEYLSEEFLDHLPDRMRRLFEMTADRNSPNPGIDNARRSSFPLVSQDACVTELRPETNSRDYDSDGFQNQSITNHESCKIQNTHNQQLRRSSRNAAKNADIQRRNQLGIQATPKIKPKMKDRKLLRRLHENILDQRREWRSAEIKIDSIEYQEALEEGDLFFLNDDQDEIDASGADEAKAGNGAQPSGEETPEASILQFQPDYELEGELSRSDKYMKNIAESKMAQICNFDPVNFDKKIEIKIEKRPEELFPKTLTEEELIFHKWAYSSADNHDSNDKVIAQRVIDSEKAISKTREDVGNLYLELRAQIANMKSELKRENDKKIEDLKSEMKSIFKAYKETTDRVLTSHVLIMNKMKERNMYQGGLLYQMQLQHVEFIENMEEERAAYFEWKDHVDGFIENLHEPDEPPYQPPVVPPVAHNVNSNIVGNTASRSSGNTSKGVGLFRGRRDSNDRSRSPAPSRGNSNSNNNNFNNDRHCTPSNGNRNRSSSRDSRSRRSRSRSNTPRRDSHDSRGSSDRRESRDSRDRRDGNGSSDHSDRRDRRDSYNSRDRDNRDDRNNRSGDDRRSSDYNNNSNRNYNANNNNGNRDDRNSRRNDDREPEIDPRWLQAEREQQNHPPERRLNYRIQFGGTNTNIRPDRLREFGVSYSEENKYQVYNFIHRFERRMQPYQVSQSQYCDALMVLIDDKLIHMAPWKDLQENSTDYYQLRKDFIDCAWSPQRQNEARNHFRNMSVCKTSSTTQCSELMIWLKVLKTTNSPFEDIIMMIYYKLTSSLRPRFTEIELQDINIFEKRLNAMTRVEEFAQKPAEPERPTQTRNIQQRSENRRSSFGGKDRRSNSYNSRNNNSESKNERTTDQQKKSYDKYRNQPKSETMKNGQKEKKDEHRYKKPNKENAHQVNSVTGKEETQSETEVSDEQTPPTSPEGSIDSTGMPSGNE
ncbi:putative uncharacterized protein DDB_G0282133 [Planococcus citri]|uniref:putative uncharacterized protein DDB_G0282133 n=1 Tax=Planococcus citri TaxID=170843 RepID=UPI0031F7D464